jgi:exosortase/archaeosortase family protein
VRYRNKFALLMMIGALLILMIPIQYFPQLTIPVRLLTTPFQLLTLKLASLLLHLAGVSSVRTGHVILLSSPYSDMAIALEVSTGFGISLLTLVTLAILYGYLRDDRRWVRVVLAISALPIAVVGSSSRIVVTGLLLQYLDPDDTANTLCNLFFFVLELTTLFILHRVISFIWKSSPKPKSA